MRQRHAFARRIRALLKSVVASTGSTISRLRQRHDGLGRHGAWDHRRGNDLVRRADAARGRRRMTTVRRTADLVQRDRNLVPILE
jgi:hypothetical protein